MTLMAASCSGASSGDSTKNTGKHVADNSINSVSVSDFSCTNASRQSSSSRICVAIADTSSAANSLLAPDGAEAVPLVALVVVTVEEDEDEDEAFSA